MIRLSEAVSAWGTSAFNDVLKREIEHLDIDQLPLQQCLSQGSYSKNDGLSVMIIGVDEEPGLIHVKAGIFYSAVIAGCSCANDPTPVEDLPEYCELRLDIDKSTGETRVVSLM
jgi:hypothetical protein